jgi:hypothetical protein
MGLCSRELKKKQETLMQIDKIFKKKKTITVDTVQSIITRLFFSPFIFHFKVHLRRFLNGFCKILNGVFIIFSNFSME